MRDLLGKFLFHLTHLDNKFVRACWQLFIPAKVTIAYFQGKIKRYPHPVQFFFIVMFFFLFVFSKSINENGLHFSIPKNQPPVRFDSVAHTEKKRPSADNFYYAIQRYALGQEFRNAVKALPPHLQSENTKVAMDSVLGWVNGKWEETARGVLYGSDSIAALNRDKPDSLQFNLINTSVKVALLDMIQMEPDSLSDHYGLHSVWERILLKQSLKSLKEPRSLVHAYLGSLTWTILILVGLMALILYLLYWRQKRYYVEHFIFLMHQHSGAFMGLTLFLLLNQVVSIRLYWIYIFLGIGISLLFAMKRYYGQSLIKTVLKWLIYCILYIISFILLFIAGLLVVFLLY